MGLRSSLVSEQYILKKKIIIIFILIFLFLITSHEGTVDKLLANWLAGTGFASHYRLQPREFFKGPMGRYNTTTPSFFSL